MKFPAVFGRLAGTLSTDCTGVSWVATWGSSCALLTTASRSDGGVGGAVASAGAGAGVAG